MIVIRIEKIVLFPLSLFIYSFSFPGQCLNFNCAWVLVLMLRHSITALRVRGFGSVLPLDHHIYLHKLTGTLIFGYSLLHTLMHLCNFSMFTYLFMLFSQREKDSLGRLCLRIENQRLTVFNLDVFLLKYTLHYKLEGSFYSSPRFEMKTVAKFNF